MTLHGHIQNGHVVFDEPVSLPDGVKVTVQIVVPAPPSLEGDAGPSLLDRLSLVVGAAKGLPPDAARNVDHYLYGQPRR
ncbi:MAG: hypothetical protein AB7O62_09145 [Pirellulales bacterium]